MSGNSYAGLGSMTILQNLLFNLFGTTFPSTATLSTPIAFTPLDGDEYDRDTTITLTMPDNDPNFSGSITLDYSRLDLGSLEPVSQNVITVAAVPFSVSDILSQINTVYGTGLTMDDVQDTIFTNAAGPFLLSATPGSIAWKNALALTVVVTGNAGVYSRVINSNGVAVSNSNGAEVVTSSVQN